MKVLLLTPLYYIKGRPNLFHDTSAIHYLIKYWSQENEVKVIYTYPNPFRKSLRYLKKSERYYLRHGYEYNVDGINVNMYEVPLRYHQKMLNKSQNKHISTQINNCLRKSGFNPDVIISHVPSFSIGYIDLLNLSVPKVAVLHQTDINRSMIDLSLINEFQEKFDYSFARSQYIYNYFQKHKLSNLKTEVISSGVKLPKHQNTKSSFKDKEFFNILFVGKLIKRKRVHIILKALQRLKEKFNFKFTIVGKGNEKRRLQKLVKKLDLQAHVVFKGEV